MSIKDFEFAGNFWGGQAAKPPRVESLELRCGVSAKRTHFCCIAIPPLVVGASIARPWHLPVISHCRGGCTGGIYAAPTNQTIRVALPVDRGRGMPRPYRAGVFYCPVGRGDPTPPCGLPVISHYRCGGNGRHICRPYKPNHKVRVAI